ncbi:MAG TPA: nucleotidyltransferase domain-containing protein [Rectinemataceae bacterium]|nr:nucleotidyltransferase domain-containing protein [Rectinemataceae bacterium]
MQLDPATRRAIEKTRTEVGASEAILFGSRARGEAANDSDADLCFIFRTFPDDPFELIYRIRRSIHAEVSAALDVLVYEQSVFERCASRRNSFESVIKNEGVIL